MKIKIKVIPKSSLQTIEKDIEGNLKVRVKSAPVKNQANEELIAMLAKYYQVSKSRVQIIKGQISKNKIVEIN